MKLGPFVMGIFDWPITKNNNQALDNPKIGMLQSFFVGLFNYINYKSII
jgi:hypothetical protein